MINIKEVFTSIAITIFSGVVLLLVILASIPLSILLMCMKLGDKDDK